MSGFAGNRAKAWQSYRAFVQQDKKQPSPWGQLKNQVYLGSDQFVDDMLCKLNPGQSLEDIPKSQKLTSPKPLSYFDKRYPTRNEAMVRAYLSGHYTLAEVGKYFGVSYATVSRAVKVIEDIVKCKA